MKTRVVLKTPLIIQDGAFREKRQGIDKVTGIPARVPTPDT